MSTVGDRSVLFDTETTGFAPLTGDRIIEIAAIEMVNDLPTGKRFHALIDPERDIPKEVARVHGITNSDVSGKPLFAEIARQLADFFGDSNLIAHNAPFDFGFLDMEFARLDRAPLCRDRMVDTLALAKARFPGMPNSLDALCRRLSIDLSARTTHHNAMLDCELLAKVYLELTGGRQRGLSMAEGDSHGDSSALPYRIHDRKSAGYFRETWAGKSRAFWEAERTAFLAQRTPRHSIVPTEAELAAHKAFLARIEDPDKAALAEDERARAEAIKSRTEPLRLAAQAAEAAWRASRPPPKIDRGQANGEVARQSEGRPVSVLSPATSTLPDLGVSRQRVAEWRDTDEEIATAAPVIALFRTAMQRFDGDADRADQWMRADHPALGGRPPEHACTAAAGMAACLSALANAPDDRSLR